jgi:alpha-L-rhamnosidase
MIGLLRKLEYLLFVGLLLLAVSASHAQQKNINPDILTKPWPAQWITGPGVPINQYNAATDAALRDYGVYKFRKIFELSSKPSGFIIHVSGDNRYKLFVNGRQVSQGPARGDLYFWNFETVDIASSLVVGTNVISAVVWNDGRMKPEAQITYLTGFILQGNGADEQVVNTNDSWKSIKDESYQQRSVSVPGYYVAGPGEFVDMRKHVRDWSTAHFNDSAWVSARSIGNGLPKEAAVNSSGWMLVPSSIPPMELKNERLSSTRKTEGVKVPANFPAAKVKVSIPPNTKATILLDQGHLTNAYPTLVVSQGKNASITMVYAEGLYQKIKPGGYYSAKGNRNEVEDKVFIGKSDSVIFDGTRNQQYTSLWWRTYRYIQLKIYTQEEPLVIEDIYGTFTGYPFSMNATLKTTEPKLDKILDIGWRTARLCAFETYMDCPYYEQLQYIGDARIQALVSYFNAGDDRLARNALTLMDHSRIAEGITLSRYPTDLHQQIPTFSLWWVAMMHDYYMYRNDSAFVREKLPGIRQVMSFFERYQQMDGSLKDVPYWTFTDWAEGPGWNFGMAPVGDKGESAILDLQLLLVYRQAIQLESELGLKELAAVYSDKASQLQRTIQARYWDNARMLYADAENKKTFSQHVNSLAILVGVIEGDDARELGKRLLTDMNMTPASIYFKYYLHQALIKTGMGDDYVSWLDKWRENISMGLTTWAEDSDVNTARSDCHAWGSSPNIEFFRTLLGIDSDAPGFSRVRVTPHLGSIREISGEMPHPNGKISVAYEVSEESLRGEVVLPVNTTGSISWRGKTQKLEAGRNVIKL